MPRERRLRAALLGDRRVIRLIVKWLKAGVRRIPTMAVTSKAAPMVEPISPFSMRCTRPRDIILSDAELRDMVTRFFFNRALREVKATEANE